ncbi:bacteriocin [Vibrio splendidus]|nr:bacteriocin [Vibrio splendidus]
MMGIEHDETRFIVDKQVHQAVSGTYDGLLSLNDIQNLSGKKLVISFNGSTPTLEKDEVKVIGRFAFVLEMA